MADAYALERTCRCCLQESATLIPLSGPDPLGWLDENAEDSQQESTFPKTTGLMLMEITNVEFDVNDGLPQGVCHICTDTLKAAYDFREKCHANDAKLREHFSLPARSYDTMHVEEENFVDVDDPFDSKSGVKIIADLSFDLGEPDPCRVNPLDAIDECDDEMHSDKSEEMPAENNADNLSHSSRVTRSRPRMNVKSRTMLGKRARKKSKKNPKLFYCFECTPPRSYSSAQAQKLHLDKHADKNYVKLTCPVCSVPFKFQFEFEKHFSETGHGHKYTCDLCDIKFLRKLDKTLHMAGHIKPNWREEESRVGAEDSGNGSNSNENAVDDAKGGLSTNKKPGKYYCVLCTPPREYSSLQGKQMHMAKHADESYVRFTCETCNAGFKFFYDMEKHCNETGHGAQYACSFCDATFMRKIQRNKHMEEHINPNMHAEVSNDDVKVPLVSETGDDAVPKDVTVSNSSKGAAKFYCVLCNPPREYSSLQAKQLHMSKHADENYVKFTCETCNAGFKFQFEMEKHSMETGHGTLYSCSICDAKFVRKIERNKHLAEHISPNFASTVDANATSDSAPKDARPKASYKGAGKFYCVLCNPTREYSSSQAYQVHMSIHADENYVKFTCETCQAPFKFLFDMEKHYVESGHGPQYMCFVCGAKFIRKTQRNKHMAEHAPYDPNASDQVAADVSRVDGSKAEGTAIAQSEALHKDAKSTGSYKGAGQFFCLLCDPPREYSSSQAQQLHMSKHADENYVKFTCETCNAPFKFQLDMEKHCIEMGHGSQYSCSMCSAKFMRKSQRNKHMAEHIAIEQNATEPSHVAQDESTFDLSATDMADTLPEDAPTSKYYCIICSPPREYSSPQAQQLHMSKHADENYVKFTCETCNAPFKFSYEIEKHFIESGHGHKYECEICEARFIRKKDKNSHMLEHKKVNFGAEINLSVSGAYYAEPDSDSSPAHSFVDEQMEDEVESFGSDNKADVNVSPEHEESVNCEESRLSEVPAAENSDAVTENVSRSKSKKRPGKFYCNLCTPPKVYSSLTAQQSHMNRHADGNYTKFACDTCSVRFKFKSDLEKHFIESGHGRVYACESCDAQFTSSLSQQKHMLEFGHKGEEMYKCDICNSQFKLFSSLSRHMKKHTPERRQHLCPICGKVFNVITSFNAHMMLHTGERPFQCDVCKKSFRGKNHLTFHKKRHLTVKPFACDYCTKTFVSKDKLTRHTRIHTGERPFACMYCEKAFYSKTNCTKHMRIHTGEMPYQCDVCGERFSQSESILKHRRKYNHFVTSGEAIQN